MSCGPASFAVGSRPVVALVAAPGATTGLVPFVAALARRVEVRSLGRAPSPAAVLVMGNGGPASSGVPPGLAVAMVEDGVVRVLDSEGTEVEGGALAVPGAPGVATATLPPVAPHVRRRWRQRLGLDPDLVIDTLALTPEDVPTALAVAAAAVVERRHLSVALALGCPVVAAADDAAVVGAVDGEHVVVGDRHHATAVAGDEAWAARLSRQGRELAVARLDPDVCASAVLDRLGLGSSAEEPVAAALDELGTAPGAPIRARLAQVLAASPELQPIGGP